MYVETILAINNLVKTNTATFYWLGDQERKVGLTPSLPRLIFLDFLFNFASALNCYDPTYDS